jgi:hypothetical protein
MISEKLEKVFGKIQILIKEKDQDGLMLLMEIIWLKRLWKVKVLGKKASENGIESKSILPKDI